MRMLTIGLALAGFGFWMIGASPAHAQASGEAWNSDHMRSQYRSVLSAPSRPAPELSGTSRFQVAGPDDTAKTRQHVEETTLPTNSWRQWGPSTSRSSGSQQPSWARNHKDTTPSSGSSLSVGGARRAKPEGSRPNAGTSQLRRRRR